jgi:AcrR family transcriptional regulator
VARGQEVRERLLTAAAELIPERGWTAVSTRVLAERAGVTPSVVHYHFASLPALLNEAAIARLRQVMAEAGDFLGSARTPAEAVEGLLAAVARYTGADPASLLTTETYLAATRDEALLRELRAVVEEFGQGFGRWLGERGVPAPAETAAVLMAVVDGLILHRGLGAAPDTGAAAAVLRRLVGQNG